MIWAFVDYENLGSLEQVDLGPYEKLLVFLGPSHKRLNLGKLPAGEFFSLEVIRVHTTGANNLDFHIAFHMGRLDATTEQSIGFHVISRDKGYDGLIAHLTGRGRNCRRIAPAAGKAAVKQPPKSLSAPSLCVSQRLRNTDGRTRPRKQESLLNWINSQARGDLNGASAELVFQELLAAGQIVLQGGAVKYQL